MPTLLVVVAHPDAELREGFLAFQRWNSPWCELIDPDRYRGIVADFARPDPTVIASTHGPAWFGGSVDRAFELLAEVADEPLPPQPGQAVLDEIVAAALAV